MSELIPITSYIDRFREAFARAEAGWLDAGRAYCEAIDKYGDDAREKLIAACPRVSPSTWRGLERVGSGKMDHRLLMASSCGASALRRIPSPLQSVALDKGVDVLIGNGETLRVQIDNLTPRQTQQVFAYDHIRDPAAQRAWLESNPPDAKTRGAAPWQVMAGGKVKIGGLILSRLDLVKIMAEMG